MNQYTRVKKHYRFTENDAKLLSDLKPTMIEASGEFIEGFYEFIWEFDNPSEFLKNGEIITYHKTKLKEWFIDLFSGEYNIDYFAKLYKIGETHVKIGLPTHFVNAAFSFVRIFVLNKIDESYKEGKYYLHYKTAAEKILDINLDTLTSSYREEELGIYLSMSRFQKETLRVLKKINSYVNLFLAASLALVAFFAIGLFLYDIYLLASGAVEIEEGILTVLGSLLVLWAAIELIHEEIKHIQGKGFAIGAFIMLALAALIRKVLIYSLSSEKSSELLIIGAVIVALSVAYWLTNKKQAA